MKRETQLELALFVLLVTFGVIGRYLEIQWNVTPTAALALFAGYMFRTRLAALLVPLAIMAISNIMLPTYNHLFEMVAVYACFLIPVFFSRFLRNGISVPRLAACTVVPSVLFFLVTNFAVWTYRRGDAYANSPQGLLDCYQAGLLFFRWMLAGDLCYTALVFGAYALATMPVFGRMIPAPVPRQDRQR